jgi:cyanophycinase
MTAGSLTLVGGGWDGDGSAFAPFVEAATAFARAAGSSGPPRIAVIAVRDGDGIEHADNLLGELHGVVDPVLSVVGLDDVVPASAFDAVHGILIGGGLTPAYRRAVLPVAARIRSLVADGMPYAGFSAGSAIAAEEALVGGWRRRGVPVVDAEVAEDLDEVTVLPGLGLVRFAIDVHAAQWGTLARLIAAVEDGLIPSGVAIDERTTLVVEGEVARVVGEGNVWCVSIETDGTWVRRLTAGSTVDLIELEGV